VHPGTLSLYVHYGQGRPKDAKSLAQCDVVITTYGILASDFSSEVVANLFTLIVLCLFASFLNSYQPSIFLSSYVQNGENNGGLFSIRWFRVVLDEAHTIKSSKSQVSMAASALIADNRWCLTGTPIQVNNHITSLTFIRYSFLYVRIKSRIRNFTQLLQKTTM